MTQEIFRNDYITRFKFKKLSFFCSNFEYFLSGWRQKRPVTRVAAVEMGEPLNLKNIQATAEFFVGLVMKIKSQEKYMIIPSFN